MALAALLLAALTVAVWTGVRDNRAGARPLVYVALGASDAVGIGADQPASEGWVPLVQAGLPSGTQLVNLGINGATLGDVLALELPVALDAQPRVVTLWPGVNDLRNGVTLDTFAAQLEQLLTALDPSGASVALLTIPDLRLLPAFASRDPVELDAQVSAWNTVIKAAAERHGVALVDLRGPSLELAQRPDYVSGDGFHPSSAGYRRIAELALDALRRQGDVPAT